MHYSKKTLFIWTLISILLFALTLFVYSQQFLSILALFIYSISLSTWFSYRLPTSLEQKKIWSCLLLYAYITIANTCVYYIYELNTLSIFLTTLPPLLLFLSKTKNNITQKETSTKTYLDRSHTLAILVFLALECYLFFHIFEAQTTDILPSPWTAFPTSFLIIFLCATLLLIYISTRTSLQKTYLYHILHLALFFGLVAIMYPLGFGFDGVIHRSAEQWIATHGFITPKNPFYIGQYAFVVWLHHITTLSIRSIDILLVPVLSTLFFPFVTKYSMKHVFSLPSRYARTLVWCIPFLFVFSFFLTTPYNLALFFLILTIMSATIFLHNKIPFYIPLVFAFLVFITHPLIGASLLFMILTLIIIHYTKKRYAKIILLSASTIVSAILPTLMFATYIYLKTQGLPEFHNPFIHFNDFFSHFALPFWYEKNTSFLWDIIYTWHRLLTTTTIIIALYGFLKFTKKHIGIWIFPLTTLAWWFAAWFLSSWIILDNGNIIEEGNYAMRLMSASILLILPFFMYGVYISATQLYTYVSKYITQKITIIILLTLASSLITLSYYFSYPQRNPKAWTPGYNISQYDKQANKLIHDMNTEKNYIVLANTINSVSALESYPFYHYVDTIEGSLFYYSIPGSGTLYRYYAEMLYEGQKKISMEHAMQFTHTNKSYFVINWYWARFADIVAGAKQSADTWYVIRDDAGKDRIYIFEYNK